MFFDKILLDEKYDFIKELDIKKIDVFKKEKAVKIYAKSNKILELNSLDLAASVIENHYGNLFNVLFFIEYEDSLFSNHNKEKSVEIIKNNFHYLIKNSSIVLNKGIDYIKIDYVNEEFVIKVANNLINNEIKSLNIENKLNELLRNYKSAKKTKILLDDTEEQASSTATEIFENELKKSLEIIKINSNTEKKIKKNNYIENNAQGYPKRRKKPKADFEMPISSISQINDDSLTVNIKGKIISIEIRELKTGSKLLIMNLTDLTDSITVKYFISEDEKFEELKEGNFVQVVGNAEFDEYEKQLIIKAHGIRLSEEIITRMDNAINKRVELHLHTGMSSMDGINSFKDYAKKAKLWGHRGMAITDHGVVQGFPEAMECADDNFKVIYGMEGYIVDDKVNIVLNCSDKNIDDSYVVFDIETTGLSPKSHDIIEIGAVKIENRRITDTFSTFVSIDYNIPYNITELTGISDEMIQAHPKIDVALKKFLDFSRDSVLVAHNASFDVSFIKEKSRKHLNTHDELSVLDTLKLSEALIKDVKNYKLITLTKKLNITLENHHRAVDDASATAQLLLHLFRLLEDRGIKSIDQLNEALEDDIEIVRQPSYHINILVKNLVGLRNLYELVSESHLEYFYKKPRILKSSLSKKREGLIIGTACEGGELYRAFVNGFSKEKIEEIAQCYDFLEIQPLENNAFLIEKGRVKDIEELKNINKEILNLGKKLGKITVATGDVHYLEKEDEIIRKILMSGLGFEDSEEQAPLYFKTTEEMLKHFSYLGEEAAYEVVVKNTNLILDMVEKILPIPKGTFPPIIEGSDEELRRLCYEKAMSIYGEDLPDIVKSRLDRELNSIIGNGYAVMYIIAQKLVKKSNEDGYIVGSRGSVGSSFAATMSSITEVNPLIPHYYCSSCQYSEFIEDGAVGSGYDLPDKDCPVCGSKLKKDGHDIPFEVFLGFEGDKEPDIDLNFAGEEQSVCMKYTEELFGKGNVFRAGTIGTIADKTAYGFVKNYLEEQGLTKRKAEIDRLIKGCMGVKRTSGQHPGGIMVVSKEKNIHDFSPLQYPANNEKSGVITTHFDYHSISGRILKLDLLGHDTPSMIRMLEDFTKIKVEDVPVDDKLTMSIFTSAEALNADLSQINCETGTLAIPEFGTAFVRQMIKDTNPKTFSDLVRISGLSHGTNVWINNAQEYIKNGNANIGNVISTRDDIMTYLIYMGVPKKKAFDIMERVRKGKGLREEDEEVMKEHNVASWYIDSCNKIEYMFPKAHAVAYVTTSVKIAYFKVHYPEAFYATYFSMKVEDFDAEVIVKGEQNILNQIKLLEEKGNEKTAKEKNLITVLEVAYEMYRRGYKFTKVDLYKSDDQKFLLSDEGIIPPLLGLQGLGITAAQNIKAEREKEEFKSVEDIIKRAKVSKTVIEVMEKHGCLRNLNKTNQISLF